MSRRLSRRTDEVLGFKLTDPRNCFPEEPGRVEAQMINTPDSRAPSKCFSAQVTLTGHSLS